MLDPQREDPPGISTKFIIPSQEDSILLTWKYRGLFLKTQPWPISVRIIFLILRSIILNDVCIYPIGKQNTTTAVPQEEHKSSIRRDISIEFMQSSV